jgi:hypothetical protein
MPEVVYPSNDEEGKSRTWADVFPVWWKEDNDEYEYINSILYRVACNSRFGCLTAETLKASIIEEMLKGTKASLETKTVNAERDIWFTNLGKMLFYINEVFNNLGGAYRASK